MSDTENEPSEMPFQDKRLSFFGPIPLPSRKELESLFQ